MDKEKKMSLTFTILLLVSIICGCSVKGFRSPIVFRSPVVFEEPESKDSSELSASSTPPEETDETKQTSALQPQPASAQATVAALFDEDLTNNKSQEKNIEEAVGVTIFPDSVVEENKTAMGETRVAYYPEKIQVFSFDDLLHLNFKMLGQASIRCHRAGKCFTRDEAINALKIEASKKYGSAAMGIVNVKLEKKPRIFFYTKGRRSISTPKESDEYHKGSADVVFLNKER